MCGLPLHTCNNRARLKLPSARMGQRRKAEKKREKERMEILSSF
jgi:hypothetical protein